jgi:hypothetical protein
LRYVIIIYLQLQTEFILSNFPYNVHPIVLITNIITKLIFYFSFISWIIPPFRQYKGGLFLYFLVLALADPIGYLSYAIFGINPFYSYIPSSIALLFVSLYYLRYLKSSIVMTNILILLMFSLFYINSQSTKALISIMAFVHFEIFCGFIIFLINKLVYRNILYTYYLCIIFYEFSLILKFIELFFVLKTGFRSSYLLTALEIFICLYFIIFNLKTSPRYHPKLS